MRVTRMQTYGLYPEIIVAVTEAEARILRELLRNTQVQQAVGRELDRNAFGATAGEVWDVVNEIQQAMTELV